MKELKYHNLKTFVAGHEFASQKEATRYCELRLLERAGEISNLQIQVPFVLIPSQKDERGKVIEKPVTYVADFVYDQDGKMVVEDTKGYKGGNAYAVFALKRKLMLQVHGIRIVET